MTSKERIKALILVGGKSSRMQQDKAKLVYHQGPQVQHLFNLLGQEKIEVFVSARDEQVETMELGNFPVLTDIYPSIGPISGILSAFHDSPSCHWLVVAVDMPMITAPAIKQLLQHFDSDKVATAFYNSEKDWVEPLFAIYSSKAYPLLLEYFQSDKKCARKFLKDKDIVRIIPNDPAILENANTPDDFIRLTSQIKEKENA